ncbi:MAG: urease accessory protein UreD [Burkholderiaceae bacterium]
MNAPQPLAQVLGHPAVPRPCWHAQLHLRVGARGEATVPLERSHRGPLRLLRGYRHQPTRGGCDCWEQIVVHPPGGIAAGDSLSIAASAATGSHLLLTAPGAAKWYRGHGAQPARQLLRLEVQAGAHLEWLPMETIVYDGAQALIENHWHVASGASLIAAELVCLGRPAGDQPFRRGRLRQSTRLVIDGAPAFIERAVLDGGDAHWRGPAGLGRASAFGTLLIVPARPGQIEPMLERVRAEVAGAPGEVGASALPRLLIVRWRGERAEHGWQALRGAWRAVRADVNGHEPVPPRIWSC